MRLIWQVRGVHGKLSFLFNAYYLKNRHFFFCGNSSHTECIVVIEDGKQQNKYVIQGRSIK